MGRNGYRVIAMLQQSMEKNRFDQMLSDNQHDEQYNSFPIDGLPSLDCFVYSIHRELKFRMQY